MKVKDVITLLQKSGNDVMKLSYVFSGPRSNMLINNSRKIADYIIPLWPDIDLRESFCVVLLTKANTVKGHVFISHGGAHATVVDISHILACCLLSNTSNIVLVHNHPSGLIKPSAADIKLTEKIKEASKYFDSNLIDHLIVSGVNTYYSFADEGLI